ncbi:MAG: family 16 glycoside hydrolase, partial [Bryobacteraceae bacterium]
PGEWQTLEVRLVGRQLTVVLNGSKIIDKREVEGLTAMASEADEAAPGPITLQGDHKEVEFRSFVVTPLGR